MINNLIKIIFDDYAEEFNIFAGNCILSILKINNEMN